MTTVFDGNSFANKILKNEVLLFSRERKLRLDIIWVGENPSSKIYVHYKLKKAESVGIKAVLHHLPLDVTQKELSSLINDLNNNPDVTGFLIQLPLPLHINLQDLFLQISSNKDVDGLSPLNLGRLWHYDKVVTSATPAGIFRIITEFADVDLEGKNIVIINDSDIVGKPLGAMLLKNRSSVTFCTKYTKDLSFYTKNADVIITATGVPRLITKEKIKEGAVLIDVGITRKNNHIVGDVDFDSCLGKASFITPVPGGVGPVTVAMLLKNLVDLAKERE